MEIRKRLSYANVASTIALFAVVAGGGAYAASQIETSDIKNKAITTKKLARGAVSGAKLADGAVSTSKLASSADGVAMGAAIINFDGSVRSWNSRFGPPSVNSPLVGEYEITWPAGPPLEGDEVQIATLAGEQNGDITARFVSGANGQPTATVFIYDNLGNPAEKSFNYVIYAGRQQ